MNKKLYQLTDIISEIPTQAGEIIEELLMEINNNISKDAEEYAHEIGVTLDREELKEIIKNAFSTINYDFILSIENITTNAKLMLAKAIENDEDLEIVLQRIGKDIIGAVEYEFDRFFNKSAKEFDEAFNYKYVRGRKSEIIEDFEWEINSRIKSLVKEIEIIIKEMIESKIKKAKEELDKTKATIYKTENDEYVVTCDEQGNYKIYIGGTGLNYIQRMKLLKDLLLRYPKLFVNGEPAIENGIMFFDTTGEKIILVEKSSDLKQNYEESTTPPKFSMPRPIPTPTPTQQNEHINPQEPSSDEIMDMIRNMNLTEEEKRQITDYYLKGIEQKNGHNIRR